MGLAYSGARETGSGLSSLARTCLASVNLVRISVMSDDERDGDKIDARVREVLDGLGLPYEIVEIDPAYADTAQLCERYGFRLEQSANTIIVGGKKEPRQYAACVVRATTRLDVNHVVRKLMGVPRLSFATAEETMALTGMLIGGVTVFALPDGVAIYVDEGLTHLPVDEVVGLDVDRHRPPVTGGEVLHQLDDRSGGGPERGDAKPRAEHIVELLLLRSVVLAPAATANPRVPR